MLVRAKIILVPLKPRELFSHAGHTLARLSGLVRLLKAQPRSFTYTFIGTRTQEQSYEGKGFYKPVAFIVDRNWDKDNRFVELLPSQYGTFVAYVARDKNQLLVEGLKPIPNQLILQLEYNDRENIAFEQNLFSSTEADRAREGNYDDEAL